jgi:hypothetical protein
MAVSAAHDAETREAFARKMEVAITDGAEMDLVVAHLNLPETA